jgi:GT2 family glycosyltransferase
LVTIPAYIIFDKIASLPTAPKVSVVILNWNGKKFLEQFVPALTRSSYKHMEVVIADNGSTDDSVLFLQSNYPQLRLIKFETNYGFAKGYNEALKKIESDYYILLNSDVEVPEHWIEPMVELLESNSNIGACQPKLLTYSDKKLFEYAGGAGGWLDEYGYPFAKGRIFDVFENDYGQYDKAEPVFWASGAAMFIRARLFHEAGGFDEFFFAHQEEIDLCWRLQLMGYQVWSCPSSFVYHVGGGTLPRGNSLKTFLNFRNNRIMMSKNIPLGRKLWLMPFRSLLDGLSAWKGLLTGDGGYFIAVLRAHIAFLGWWFFHKKESVFPKSKNGKLSGYLQKNLVWQHFVKKKKYFSEIVRKSE